MSRPFDENRDALGILTASQLMQLQHQSSSESIQFEQEEEEEEKKKTRRRRRRRRRKTRRDIKWFFRKIHPLQSIHRQDIKRLIRIH